MFAAKGIDGTIYRKHRKCSRGRWHFCSTFIHCTHGAEKLFICCKGIRTLYIEYDADSLQYDGVNWMKDKSEEYYFNSQITGNIMRCRLLEAARFSAS